ncbi:hypothetical protein KGM_203493B, partial [Danaus plexippus plexippus]
LLLPNIEDRKVKFSTNAKDRRGRGKAFIKMAVKENVSWDVSSCTPTISPDMCV